MTINRLNGPRYGCLMMVTLNSCRHGRVYRRSTS